MMMRGALGMGCLVEPRGGIRFPIDFLFTIISNGTAVLSLLAHKSEFLVQRDLYADPRRPFNYLSLYYSFERFEIFFSTIVNGK